MIASKEISNLAKEVEKVDIKNMTEVSNILNRINYLLRMLDGELQEEATNRRKTLLETGLLSEVSYEEAGLIVSDMQELTSIKDTLLVRIEEDLKGDK